MISVNLFFSMTIIGTILSTFSISTKGMYINRTFLNIPLSIFENSIDNISKSELNDEVTLDNRKEYYFNTERVIYNVNSYLKTSFKNNLDSYLIGFKFLKVDGNSVSLNEINPNKVDIRLKANYYKFFNFDSSLSFSIEREDIDYYE